MDPLTQGLLGAGLASSFSKKDTLKVTAICGAVGGMAPDLDVFIRSAANGKFKQKDLYENSNN